MSPKRMFAVVATLLAASVIFSALPALGQYPGSGQLPLDPRVVPKFVDPLPHFAGARIDATVPGTPLTVEMMPVDQQALSTGTVLPNGTIVGGGAGLTHAWGYRISNGTVTQGPLWPGFTVEAMRGVPLDVLYLNNLNESYDAVNLAADQTLHWAMGTYDAVNPYTGPVPAVAHLHGGEVPAWSDGGPDAWYTPGGAVAGHAALTNLLHYPNTQEPATLWFHDHALGATRLNVYAGMAAFYFLRDAAEDALMLPGWSGDGMVQEIDPVTGAPGNGPYLPEIEVAIQDRMFDQNGQLYFPAGALVAPNPAIHPFWVPEFSGDIITVNGKTWPYMSVAPRKYRFRFLNGSNARFYVLSMPGGPQIFQVGTDGGLLDTPVAISKLTMGPGERADLIIDFTGLTGTYTLKNAGRTPFPKGPPPNGATTGQIMQFVVNGQMVGADNSVVTGRAVPLEKLSTFAGTLAAGVTPVQERQLTLNEVIGAGGPLEVLVNNTKWTGASTRPYGDFQTIPGDPSGTLYSEIVKEGDTEVWKIINITADAHPIHLHLVQFQLVSRQAFNTNKYLKAYNAAFPGGAFIGGYGPPMDYNVNQTPAAAVPTIGGNPDITAYLQGMAKSAEPNEMGWKDTFIMYPGEVTTVVVRWAPTDATAQGVNYFDFSPDGGHGYVWHCHIIDHEDNEMMRPYSVIPNGPAGRLSGPLYPGYQNVHPAAVAMAFQADGAQMNTSTLPRSASLDQNYPNPFNPTTNIRFTLPAESNVTLVLYNAAGQEVATLINGVAPAGHHTVTLDATGLTSGVYFYKLTAGNFTETKKMTLLK